VISDGVKSSVLAIIKGVPQGSVLGPILFTVYINNISRFVKTWNINLYVNNTVMPLPLMQIMYYKSCNLTLQESPCWFKTDT
jgi:hypothetical protein